jgi:hypothetical protein
VIVSIPRHAKFQAGCEFYNDAPTYPIPEIQRSGVKDSRTSPEALVKPSRAWSPALQLSIPGATATSPWSSVFCSSRRQAAGASGVTAAAATKPELLYWTHGE